jgi:hypothetical protein
VALGDGRRAGGVVQQGVAVDHALQVGADVVGVVRAWASSAAAASA